MATQSLVKGYLQIIRNILRRNFITFVFVFLFISVLQIIRHQLFDHVPHKINPLNETEVCM